MKFNKTVMIISFALIIGAALGLLCWWRYGSNRNKIPDSATSVMHNISFFGEFI